MRAASCARSPPGIEANIFPGKNVMLSVVRIKPHSSGTVHSHPEEQ